MTGFEPRRCRLCLSEGPHAVIDRTCNNDGSFTVLHCAGCQSLFQPEPVLPDLGLTWLHEAQLRVRLELLWDSSQLATLLAIMVRGPGCRFLHVGCGLGLVVDMAAQVMGWTATGIEPSEEAEAGQTLFGAVIQRAWIDADELPDGPYDVVLVSDALRLCDDPVALLCGIRDRLAPGGTVLIETASASALPQPPSRAGWAGLMPGGMRAILPTAHGLLTLLKATGFPDAACAEVGGYARAWSGPSHLVTVPNQVADLAGRYLTSLRSRMRPGSPLWNAGMARLFHLRVEACAFLAAHQLLAEMGAAWEGPFGIDPARPGLIPGPLIGHEPPDAIGHPLVLAMVLADQARNLRRTPGCDPLQALAFDRKAYSVAVETARYLERLGQPSAALHAIAKDSRAVMIEALAMLVPELRHDILAGTTRPSGMTLDAIIDPASTYPACISSFISAVHQGRYWDASRLAPLLSDMGAVKTMLSGDTDTLCMLVYCLGILALNGRRDMKAAAALFSELAAIADSAGPDAAHYAELARRHMALASP